ncbi:serine hydrolase domain-containing protein [Aspergillus lucknowensis]|uniref:Beta-lactamase/transpeptidase-like protein n=1 Tax=Aspergillus lucknowensis TaxID=176173 RepID=A0ABR4LD27_9EURO
MTSIQGHCDPHFAPVRDILAQNLSSEKELGASICVSIHGKPVIDVWGGHATPARDRPWEQDTIVPVWSISKTITALAALLLIDRGQLDPDDPVAKYWPAFDTEDKRPILVRHLLAHTAGLPSWEPEIDFDTLFNVPLATEKLLSQKPWWEPGSVSGYHLISHGHLLNGLIERVAGKPLGEFVREELSLPRGADFHMGITDEKEWARIGELLPAPEIPREALEAAAKAPGGPSIAVRAFMGFRMQAAYSATPEFRRSGIGSIGGFSNAKGFNRILDIITLGGEVDGVRYLKPETVDLIFQTQTEGPDLILGDNLKMGIGFGLANGTVDWMPTGRRVCFWGGWGGSLAVMDLDRGVTFTYAMNRMEQGTLGNSNAHAYIKAVYKVLDGIEQASL